MSELNDPRVLFAAERTLLGWTRTSLALITIGFLVERAGFLVELVAPEKVAVHQAAMVFWLGVAFILLGAFAAVHASWQYLVALRSLTAAEYPSGYNAHWGVVLNLIVAPLGILLAVAVYLSASS